MMGRSKPTSGKTKIRLPLSGRERDVDVLKIQNIRREITRHESGLGHGRVKRAMRWTCNRTARSRTNKLLRTTSQPHASTLNQKQNTFTSTGAAIILHAASEGRISEALMNELP
jgi:hypothetical protein